LEVDGSLLLKGEYELLASFLAQICVTRRKIKKLELADCNCIVCLYRPICSSFG